MGSTIITANGLKFSITHDADKFSWEDSWVIRWLRALQNMDSLSPVLVIKANKPSSQSKMSYKIQFVDGRTHGESYDLNMDEPYNLKKAKRHASSSDGFTEMEHDCCEECCKAFGEMYSQLHLTTLAMERV